MRILKNDTIALVVDFQERLFPVIHQNDKLQNNVTTLLQGLNTLCVPMIVTEQYRKGLGATIEPIALLVEDKPNMEKIAFSCCDEPSILEKIELSGRRTILICGIESHICVLQTAIDLKERGFKPVVVADCVASRTEENKQIALERMKQEGIILTSYESILFELCRYSGSDEFKAISKLVK
jgi:nicotinamidase-related amidase